MRGADAEHELVIFAAGTGTAVGMAIGGIVAVLVISAVFYAIGRGEDRDRAAALSDAPQDPDREPEPTAGSASAEPEPEPAPGRASAERRDAAAPPQGHAQRRPSPPPGASRRRRP